MKKTKKTANKRKNPRIECDLKGVIRCNDRDPLYQSYMAQRREFPEVTVSNVSRDGFRLTTDRILQPGDILKLEFNAGEGGTAIPFFGEVCWSRNGQSGLHILALNEEARATLQEVLHHAKELKINYQLLKAKSRASKHAVG